MENRISAYIPAHIRPHLFQGRIGEVLLVTSAGIYLQFDGQILMLCDRAWGVLPIGIGLEDFPRTAEYLRLQQGQPVTVGEDCLIFPSGELRLEEQVAPCAGKKTHAPQRRLVRQAAEELAALGKERGLSMLVMPLVLDTQPADAAMPNPYCARGLVYFRKLMRALRDGDSGGIRGCLEKLLGLGPGLTPSGDDVLLGMLYIFRTIPQRAPEGAELLAAWIGRLWPRCTHPISGAYLQAMIDGGPFERMDRLFRGLCGEDPLEIETITRIGSSSGSEMLLGMLLALKLCGYDAAQREEKI